MFIYFAYSTKQEDGPSLYFQYGNEYDSYTNNILYLIGEHRPPWFKGTERGYSNIINLTNLSLTWYNKFDEDY